MRAKAGQEVVETDGDQEGQRPGRYAGKQHISAKTPQLVKSNCVFLEMKIPWQLVLNFIMHIEK